MQEFRMHQRVEIEAFSGAPNLKGLIVGLAGVTRLKYSATNLTPCYLVELDQGFYNKDESCYVSILVVHADSIKPL